MKNTLHNTLRSARILGLALCLGVTPVAVLVSGCAGDRDHQSTGESIDDEGISMRVRHALSNDTEYKYDNVSVKTFKGTVQLSGWVDNHAQKSRAEELAKGADGVTDVENNISIRQ